MKTSILVMIISLCSTFAANACPTQANDWISGKWSCESENPDTLDTLLRLTLKNDQPVAILKMEGDGPSKDIRLDGPLLEKDEHVLVDEGSADNYNKVTYSAVCDDRQNTISVQFRTVYKSATKFLLSYTFSPGDVTHLNIHVVSDQQIGDEKTDNKLVCTRKN